jgi:hypothetical protein
MFRCRSVTVIFASATAAPLPSVTMPEIKARDVCAHVGGNVAPASNMAIPVLHMEPPEARSFGINAPAETAPAPPQWPHPISTTNQRQEESD